MPQSGLFHRTCGAVSRVFKVLRVLRVLKVLKVSASPIGYPKVNPERPSNGNQIGAPKTNQDFVCLLWGEAEVRVAHYPLGTQK